MYQELQSHWSGPWKHLWGWLMKVSTGLAWTGSSGSLLLPAIGQGAGGIARQGQLGGWGGGMGWGLWGCPMGSGP